MDSVRDWAASCGFDYRFLGDEIFDPLPGWYRQKLNGRMPILADLARLYLLRDALENGHDTAVWLDADTLVFAPDAFDLGPIDATAAFGREIWVDIDAKGKMKAWRNTHNAACLFRKGDTTLPFLIDTTERIIARADPDRIAPQMVGPKLLSALDTIAGFSKLDAVHAFSPPVIADIDRGGGPALDRLKSEIAKHRLPTPVAANLCASLISVEKDVMRVERIIERLLSMRALP
ncbi:MAG: hypothetical protein RIM33_00535 [Alphaproteobacteria bacterium]